MRGVERPCPQASPGMGWCQQWLLTPIWPQLTAIGPAIRHTAGEGTSQALRTRQSAGSRTSLEVHQDRNRPVAGVEVECGTSSAALLGAWPSGKATDFGSVTEGSNPSAPAKLRTFAYHCVDQLPGERRSEEH